MPLNSVQTNTGAMSAVRAMAGAASELAVTRERLATGLAVVSARDNGAVWAIARKQRGDVAALGVVVGSLQRGQGIASVALAAGETVVDLLSQIKQRALAASDFGMADRERASLHDEFTALRERITATVRDAAFDGVNLVGAGAANSSVLAGLPLSTTVMAPVPGGGNGGGSGGNGGGSTGGGAAETPAAPEEETEEPGVGAAGSPLVESGMAAQAAAAAAAAALETRLRSCSR
jgi:hypothetical protein